VWRMAHEFWTTCAGMAGSTAPNPNSFVLLSCESHSRDTGEDKSLELAFQSLNLKQRLEAIQTAVAGDDAKIAFLPGSGAVYMCGCKHAVVEDRWMAIFAGCELPQNPCLASLAPPTFTR
jgi:hypothetical protein